MTPEDRLRINLEEKHRRHLWFCLLNGKERLLAAAKQALADEGLAGSAREELQAAVDECEGRSPPLSHTERTIPKKVSGEH